MAELIEVSKAIWNTSQRLDKGIDTIFKKAKEYAAAERDYRIALSKEIVKLKGEGMPVTLIRDVSRGNVADLKFNRDLAQECYKTSKEMLNGMEAQLSSLQTLIKFQKDIEGGE